MSIQLLTYNNLNEHSKKIAHFSSTRIGGYSSDSYASFNLGEYTLDSPAAIAANRQLLALELGISVHQIYNAHQIHGKSVKLIDTNIVQCSNEERKNALQGFDALICNTPGCCITVTTADCVPILLYDPIQKAIAAIHSGWKSTLLNIVQETIQKMTLHFDSDAKNLIAAIGPCISKDVYEVGEDVYNEFIKKGFDTGDLFATTTNNKYLFDIRKTVHKQLLNEGIKNIELSPYCTYTNNELFFSARRQGSDSGRMLSGILIR
ncbi:MAG: peptidoglycan editing factor PgeF [Paludibacteraceae bacterium]|nr:peptidoglycan editing factor PgeF [Paludibacteraceae bacterium]MBN2787236.1 peptidoglycan editing factor PgeF [Paludibacteraceae bacterium]